MRSVLFWIVGTLALAGCSGDRGPAGAAGSDGADGTSCTITDNGDGTKTIECEDGTTAIVNDGTDGTDGDSCTVVDNGDGTKTITCDDGTSVDIVDGAPGADGAGLASENCVVCHSDGNLAAVSTLHAPVEAYEATIVDVAITTTADITFEVKDEDGYFVNVGLYEDAGWLNAAEIDFYLAKLDATTGDWYNVLPDQRESGDEGTFVSNGDGTYTYTTVTDISAGYTDADTDGPFPARDIGYDADATYRASLAFGGHGHPAASPHYDFRPDDGTVTDTRNIVSNATCVKCHGNDFHGHGGDRKTLENCVTCHNPTALSNDLANNIMDGETDSADMAVMIHNIHNGTNDYWIRRVSSRGNSWYNWGETPDPEPTPAVLDGGQLTTHPMGFPQPSWKCTACHETDTTVMSDGLAWQQNPSVNDCGNSCHTSFFEENPTHGNSGDDTTCAGCHADGAGFADISEKHSTANTDIISAADLALDTPEYTIAMTLLDASDNPLTSTDDIEGIAAKIKIEISDGSGLIDHTTITNFDHVYLFVYGPRARAKPVLTTAAAAGGGGYFASNDLATDTAATITTDAIVYQLAEATGLEDGTYAAYVDLANDAGDATDGYQAPSVAKMNFQVGTTEVEKQVAGNCMSCHGDTKMHTGKDNEHRHDTSFDAEACAACHDYVNGLPTANSYEWFGGNPNSKRIHAVHAAPTLIDPDYTIGHAPPEGHMWEHIIFPALLSDCTTCHQDSVSTDAWANNANQLACMGCHDTPEASDHMFLMGGEPPPAATP